MICTQTLSELCLSTLITNGIPDVVVMDKIPYDLYEKYKTKKISSDNLTIPSIVKCIVSIELFHEYYYIPSNQPSIIHCVKKKLDLLTTDREKMWKIFGTPADIDSNDINSNPIRAIQSIKPFHRLMRKLDIQTYVSI